MVAWVVTMWLLWLLGSYYVVTRVVTMVIMWLLWLQ